MTSITMPQLGETIVEGTILKWLKREGDRVERDEPLFEISTDKVDTEVPSPAAGVLARILVQEGATVKVGTPLAEIEEEGAAGGAPTERAEEGPAERAEEAPAAEERPTPSPDAEAAPSEGRTEQVAEAAAPSPGAAPAAPAPRGPEPAATGPRSQILSPLVRRLAAEHGVDLAQVRGTGTGGRITKQDVLAYVERMRTAPAPAPGAAPPQPQPAAARPAAGEREEVVPMSVVRRAIAKHMTQSLQTTARAWTLVEVNMERVVRLREEVKDAFEAREGFKLTYTPFVARAVVDALLAFPMVNAELRGEEIVLKRYVNLGIAVSYDEGLIVPVVKGADGMNLVGLARAINDVAARARAHQLRPDEVHGGTFTITNPGPFGSVMSVPIIALPQTGILSFDAIEKRPVVVDDAIAIRHMVYLSMSWDHRVIDGAEATKFLARVKRNLETWDFAEDLRR
jgi:2-oxoglutarate dehydrogenase E2 component (dihydrolipoamide succinyltransferase)